MFEGKPLSEVTYENLVEFLKQRQVEREDLDYKQERTQDLVKTLCAMANTAGGNVLVGIKEERDGRSKTNRPDPDDIPGIENTPDIAASLAAQVRSRTRLALVPEVEAIAVEGKPDRVVLAARVIESPDAPHEVRIGPSPEILVKRRDNTESAGIDDVERLSHRRDALREPGAREADIDFFENQVSLPGQGRPPVVAVWMRPRLASGLRFNLDYLFDQELEYLFRKHYLGNETFLAPFASGVALEGKKGGVSASRIEVRENGTIRGAWALPHTPAEFEDTPGARGFGSEPPRETCPPQLRLDDFARRLLGAARFASAAYGMRRTAVEVELLFGLHRCQNFRVFIPEVHAQAAPVGSIYDPTAFDSYTGRVPGHPMGNDPSYGTASLRTAGEGPDAKPVEEDLLKLLRTASRAVGISAPDARLERYLR